MTYVNEDDAVKAVSQLDKTEISGRQVNVEVAKPAPAGGSAAARAPRRAAKKAADFASTGETAQEGVAGEEGVDGAAAPRKARKAVRFPFLSTIRSDVRLTLVSNYSASPVAPALPVSTTRLRRPETPPPFPTSLISSPAPPSRMAPLLPVPVSPVPASPARARPPLGTLFFFLSSFPLSPI